MAHTDNHGQMSDDQHRAALRSNRSAAQVRLRTLVLIRWIAIAGQLAALMIVRFGLNWPLPLDAALVAIGASVLLNMAMTFRRPVRGRLSEWEAAAYLAFDILQLAVLLYLTGGLENPFSLLFLGPVTVSATTLSRSATALLSILVIGCASLLAFYHLPLPWSGDGLQLPAFYIGGLWTAVVVGTLFLGGYIGSVAGEGRRMSDALTATQLALAREQQLSALGGLAAAAAHELGSPLATIAVTAKELTREIPRDSEYADDVRILQTEADRCRDILAELGRAPELADPDDPLAFALISDVVAAVLDRIGEPYISNRGQGHLGLGIFIAQSLLERTGARIRFSNARVAGRMDGAEVSITWPRADLEVDAGTG